ncbi:hypothetical protein E2562_032681 [Oryza meyeriana var. granulata]|uniref:Uncharacterized protein n=1 Tax=Oryza meyeriana var. granulata TaxID=110450 RepID=A0A6G1FEQ2_9ORYZ|nr:hypothetical protein E2562_032681 [Oryza meyeriana var. granulata]
MAKNPKSKTIAATLTWEVLGAASESEKKEERGGVVEDAGQRGRRRGGIGRHAEVDGDGDQGQRPTWRGGVEIWPLLSS